MNRSFFKCIIAAGLLVGPFLEPISHATAAQRALWTKVEADHWIKKHGWVTGSNYIPANSINQLEMWQAST